MKLRPIIDMKELMKTAMNRVSVAIDTNKFVPELYEPGDMSALKEAEQHIQNAYLALAGQVCLTVEKPGKKEPTTNGDH